MPAWPLTDGFLLGLVDQAEDAVARTPMDTGPSTTRNRFTAVTRTVAAKRVLTGADRQTLDNFFTTTLENGALPFDWKDPSTLATVSYKFRTPPSYTLIRPGTANSRLWSVALDLEIQP